MLYLSGLFYAGGLMNDYEKPDYYSKLAVKEGYAARSVYKLMEIQDKLSLIKKGNKILDLGCAPGSWSQYASSLIGLDGQLIGVDFKRITVNPPNAVFIRGNFLKDHVKEELMNYSPFDGVISDMAPDTSGDRLTDCFLSSDLVRQALDFAYSFLKKGGYFVAKIFQGGDEKGIMDEMKLAFEKTRWFKPKSSRQISFEIFMIGSGFIKKPEIKHEDGVLDDENYTGDMPW